MKQRVILHALKNKLKYVYLHSGVSSNNKIIFNLMVSEYTLIIYCLNSVLRRFLSHDLKYALIIYRLIDTVLIGCFLTFPSYL